MKQKGIIIGGVIAFAAVILLVLGFWLARNSFTLEVANLESEEPVPDIIARVQPPNDDVVERRLGQSTNVCVKVYIQPLLEKGDDILGLDNFELAHNGHLIDPKHILQESVDEAVCIEDDERVCLTDNEGNLLGTGLANTELCWRAYLLPGTHVMDLEVWSTSGKIRYDYEWDFVVVRP